MVMPAALPLRGGGSRLAYKGIIRNIKILNNFMRRILINRNLKKRQDGGGESHDVLLYLLLSVPATTGSLTTRYDGAF